MRGIISVIIAKTSHRPMSASLNQQLAQQLEELRAQGLYKNEQIITSAQSASVDVSDQSNREDLELLNFCANNYLGLANHPTVVDAAKAGLESHGFGMASVRFICGTQDLHKQLERELSDYLGMPDTILYSSCFDANAGLFETLLDGEDAIISDALNHASIIDGVRLCKAKRYRYANNDMAELEACLIKARADNARHILIATDGVFSMDGIIADLPAICDLADKYDAMVMVDDSHAVGFVGKQGRGSHEYHEVMGRIDIITGTLGKALGGASGGFTSASKEVIAWLRQRSRPYLFSNSLAPAVVNASLAALSLIRSSNELRQQLEINSAYFREQMEAAGFELAGAGHPIVPVMLGDAELAAKMAQEMLALGIYVVAFSFPVVPQDKARIRTQMSAAHTTAQIDAAVNAFTQVGTQLGVIA